MCGAVLPDVPCSFILTSQTFILIVHICLVLAIRLPRAQAEHAEVYFYKAVRVPVTGDLPSAWTERAGLQLGEGGNLRRQGLEQSLGDFGGELQSLRIRKVRISKFLPYLCFQMCHFQSRPLMHTCF